MLFDLLKNGMEGSKIGANTAIWIMVLIAGKLYHGRVLPYWRLNLV
jgi:hypothetical protein